MKRRSIILGVLIAAAIAFQAHQWYTAAERDECMWREIAANRKPPPRAVPTGSVRPPNYRSRLFTFRRNLMISSKGEKIDWWIIEGAK